MSNSNYSIGLQRLKLVYTPFKLTRFLMWPAQFGRKLVLGTRGKWPRPRRWQFFSRRDVGTSRDRDHNPGSRPV